MHRARLPVLCGAYQCGVVTSDELSWCILESRLSNLLCDCVPTPRPMPHGVAWCGVAWCGTVLTMNACMHLCVQMTLSFLTATNAMLDNQNMVTELRLPDAKSHM